MMKIQSWVRTVKIKPGTNGWLKRLEPEEGKKLRICWMGDGLNQRWDVDWIEIIEEDSQFIEKGETGVEV